MGLAEGGHPGLVRHPFVPDSADYQLHPQAPAAGNATYASNQQGDCSVLTSTGQEICCHFNYETCTKGAEWHYAHKCWGPGCGGDHPTTPFPRIKLELPRAHIPLRSSTFEQELRNHPNEAWISWLLSDIDNGVSTGCNGPRFPHTARNLASALKHPDA